VCNDFAAQRGTASLSRWTSVVQTHAVLIGWESVFRLVTSKTRYRATADVSEVIENMERETGIEPSTSSLGKRRSFENKELTRPLRCILTTETAEKTQITSKRRQTE
jgi:hypothetical protein